MSKRNRREHGRILSVETMQRGSALDVDAAAGATSITVTDGGDFDEDGGWLYIGAQVVEFTECDDDTGVITLADPLTAAAEQGDPVAVYDPLYGEVVDYQVALVQLDGEYDNPDPVEAEVAEGVEDLPEGDRGKAGESCTLRRVADDEWELIEIGGRPRKSRSIRWEQDDAYTLTAADITAGTATVPLSKRPIDESVKAWWRTTPQRPTNYSVNYDAQTITWPLSGFEAAGDTLWVHYAYRKGISTATSVGTPTYIGVTTVVGPTTSVAIPAGAQAGDSLILAECDWDGATCSDPRMTLHDTLPGAFTPLGRVWVGTADGSGTPLAVNFAGSAGRCSTVLIALRSAQINQTLTLSDVSPAAASGNAPQVASAQFAVTVAMMRNDGFTTGTITHVGGSYAMAAMINGGLKTSVAVGYWNNTASSRATSPAETFGFTGTADAWAITTYKIEGV